MELLRSNTYSHTSMKLLVVIVPLIGMLRLLEAGFLTTQMLLSGRKYKIVVTTGVISDSATL
jgi:hypothetical protein